jgi:class 3 adenylate cyclase
MSWRIRLLLLATAVGVVFPFVLSPFQRLEWKSYDTRLGQVRATRGNIAPSLSLRLFGLDEKTLRRRPGWDARALQTALNSLLAAEPTYLWVDPRLPGPRPPGASQTSSLNPVPEADGVVRKLELVGPQGQLSPALEAYAALRGVPRDQIVVREDKVAVGGQWLPRRLAIDFPTHQADATQVSESANAAYLEPISLYLLDEPDSRSILLQGIRGAAVLVCGYDAQARYISATPVGPLQSFQLEYAALDTLLSDWILRQPSLPVQLTLVTLWVLLMASLTFFVHSTWRMVLVWLGLNLGYHQLCLQAFVRGWWLPEAPAVVGGLLAVAVIAIAQRTRALRLISRLLGAERALTAAQGEVSLGGREREVTIVFTNLPESVKALEAHDPEGSIAARNKYNAVITDVVRKHRGWVLDYQGDAIMAGFGVEQLDHKHALHAVGAALQLHKLLSEQYPTQSIHCGVCSGPAAVGLVGAPGAKALAAIGDTTNVAARLMGAAMKQKVGVLISKRTHDHCPQFLHATPLPPVSLKGKTSVVEVYEVTE